MQRQQLEELYSAHPGSLSILMEADDGSVRHPNHGFPEGPANFTLLWSGHKRSFSWDLVSPVSATVAAAGKPGMLSDTPDRLDVFAAGGSALGPERRC